ncbi:MAG: alpha-L-arabinofuranosidase C-terminal domain-containing protein [Armatimonadota bacterium]
MRIALVVVLLAACGLGYAAGPATIVVRPAREIGAVNPLVFGNNQLAYVDPREEYGNRGAGIWNPETRAPVPEYADLAREAGITINRWPGGCGVHYYDWKQTVGPLDQRPEQQFGLPEFLKFCAATDSIPVLTIADFWGTPQDAADLVEYCNAPADGSNPNGGQDWAAVRAADGIPEPVGVVWFEYGNETWHGGHWRLQRDRERTDFLPPEEYGRRYHEYRAAMRAVDPAVHLGAVMHPGMDEWNRPVLATIGPALDFGILHIYIPGFRGDTNPENYRRLMQACTACGPQIEHAFDGMDALVRAVIGRDDLPWAITEHNGSFVGQRESPPFRQSLANALRNAEFLRVAMQPARRVIMANFWQFANEYWGMVQGYVHRQQPQVKQANFYTYQLYAGHFGDTLVAVDVQCGRWEFLGGAGVAARLGEPTQFELREENLLPEGWQWRLSESPVVMQEVEGQTLTAQFSGPDTNYYHATVTIPAKPLTGYRVTGEIRTEGLATARGVGFQVGDARGWTPTRSASNAGNVLGDSDWTPVVVEYVTLADTQAIAITCRRIGQDGGDTPISGSASFRLVSVQEFTPWSAGAVPDLSVNAGKRADGSVTLIIVNTNLDEDIATTIVVEGVTGDAAHAWSLVGPEPWAHNTTPEALAGGDPPVYVVSTPIAAADGGWALTVPKCSLTAVEIGP